MILLALAGTAGGGTAPGQHVLTGAALVAVTEHRVDAGFGLERVSGPLLGAEATLEIGRRWELAGRFLGGTLSARNAGALEREIGEAALEGGARVLPWLTTRGTITRRVHQTTLARQVWVLVGLGAEARIPIAGGAVHGIARGAMLPAVWVNGLEAPSLAFTAAAGMEYRRGPASLGLLFTLERCDFSTQTTPRLEQVSALAMRAAWRF